MVYIIFKLEQNKGGLPISVVYSPGALLSLGLSKNIMGIIRKNCFLMLNLSAAKIFK